VRYAFVQDVAASWEQYEPIRTVIDERAPSGLIAHLAGPTDEGFRIIAVWESEEAWTRFQAEWLAPALVAIAPSSRPQPVFRDVYPLHAVLRMERPTEVAPPVDHGTPGRNPARAGRRVGPSGLASG
jgi:hypothetical protein